MATMTETTDRQVQTSLSVLQDMLRGYRPRDFAVRCWDGTTWDPEPGRPANFTLVLNHPGSVRAMFWPPRPLTMGQALLYDDFNVEGDMVAFAGLCHHLSGLKRSLSAARRLRLGWRLWNLPRVERPRTGRQAVKLSGAVHSRERDRQAIAYHYDTSNEFFALILDPSMTYTSGIWVGPEDDLATAQERKLDLICRKLRLKPGDRFLDVGCGWGGLVRHAARNYGAHAVGATISEKQVELAREKVGEDGLGDRCRVELVDYRDVDEGRPFDAIAIVEVGEHFGAEHTPEFFRKCWRLLRPGGQILMQQITLARGEGLAAAREFSQHYVFPDGELLPVSRLCAAAEQTGFEVRDAECLRQHYPFTLRAWLHNLEARHDEVVKATDEATYRAFRLYFAGACNGFLMNVYQLHQILFVKPDPSATGYPPRREDWYGPAGGGS